MREKGKSRKRSLKREYLQRWQSIKNDHSNFVWAYREFFFIFKHSILNIQSAGLFWEFERLFQWPLKFGSLFYFVILFNALVVESSCLICCSTSRLEERHSTDKVTTTNCEAKKKTLSQNIYKIGWRIASV